MRIIRRNHYFLAPWVLVLFIAITLLASGSRTELHLAINRLHHPLADYLFRYLTWLGDGLFAAGLVLLLLMIRMRYAIYMAGACVSSGLSVQLLKHLVFPGALRPYDYFTGYDLHVVPGVKMLHHYSFPSGHAATALAVFFVLAYIVPGRAVKLASGILAVLVAFSRVYLSLHFVGDILAGSLIGLLFSMFCIYLTDRLKTGWPDKALPTLIFKPRENEADNKQILS